ncbi:hypothetical protein RFF05_06790 [Bengtsoniella intestinalis]|uniref:hypothetical protein n=1 Tax=Bengtsoniella intestinalis TaxID=3073143 RepID=UPI00391F49B5
MSTEPEVVVQDDVAPKPKRKATKAKAAVAEKKRKSYCVYLGPSIRGVIQRGAIFQGEKSEVLKALDGAVAKYPEIKYLVVADETLATDRIKIKTAGNLLYVKNNQLMSRL